MYSRTSLEGVPSLYKASLGQAGTCVSTGVDANPGLGGGSSVLEPTSKQGEAGAEAVGSQRGRAPCREGCLLLGAG